MSAPGPVALAKLDPVICYRALTTRDSRFDGRFFTAVRTTGIYCRPVCPAQTPKPENVTFYPTAAAAEVAGYRSCLRCRPERAPGTAVANPLVERAMALIALGCATDGAGLSARLGVGERQLRRLFTAHLGASPKQVAETRRHLLARQLVVETSLPLTDVALAAGFGSLRRFNHVFRMLYGQPPSQMRRRSVKTESGPGFTITLPFRPPYDWDGVITALGAHAIPGVEAVTPQSYARLITLGGHHGTVVVSPGGADCLTAQIDFPKLAYLPEIVARLRGLFDLTADTTQIDAHLAADPALGLWIGARPGMRVPGAWNGFECAVRIILGQQVSVASGRRLAAALVTRYGTPVETGIPGLTGLFPTPERLVEVADRVSLDLNMPRARAAAIINLARAEADNPDLLAPGGDLAASIARLTAVAGIGPWTAHCIALFALREPDAFPAQDVGLQRVLGLTAKALEARSASWRPWRAYAALHLWLQALGSVPPARTTTKTDEEGLHDALVA
jgi:AraC family transcriptional regulator of adaptative response / DNA-3-methyladenine glycosylase II